MLARLGHSCDRIHFKLFRATHAGFTHATGDDRGVGSLATPAGQDADRCDHPAEIVGVRLAPDEDDVLSSVRPLNRGPGVEDRLSHGGAG